MVWQLSVPRALLAGELEERNSRLVAACVRLPALRFALGLLLPPSAAMANSLKVVVAADDSDGYETMVLGAGAGTLCVVDVYNSWCGPCEALSRKIGTLFNELGEFDIKFVQAKADAIKALAEFAVPARSKPLFLFIKGGKEVARMDGANPIELEKLVTANATKRQ